MASRNRSACQAPWDRISDYVGYFNRPKQGQCFCPMLFFNCPGDMVFYLAQFLGMQVFLARVTPARQTSRFDTQGIQLLFSILGRKSEKNPLVQAAIADAAGV